jgi:hypothetical protein
MASYRLPSGRVVYLVRLKMVGTYSGCLEGTAKTNSERIRERLPERSAKELPPARPLAVVAPPTGELPAWLCVAELESRQGVHHTDPDYSSRLYACWFATDMDRSVNSMIEAILPHLNWEELAEDYDIMDF